LRQHQSWLVVEAPSRWALIHRSNLSFYLNLSKSRWDASYEAVSLADVPHRRLTRPVKVLEQFFDGERKARSR